MEVIDLKTLKTATLKPLPTENLFWSNPTDIKCEVVDSTFKFTISINESVNNSVYGVIVFILSSNGEVIDFDVSHLYSDVYWTEDNVEHFTGMEIIPYDHQTFFQKFGLVYHKPLFDSRIKDMVETSFKSSEVVPTGQIEVMGKVVVYQVARNSTGSRTFITFDISKDTAKLQFTIEYASFTVCSAKVTKAFETRNGTETDVRYTYSDAVGITSVDDVWKTYFEDGTAPDFKHFFGNRHVFDSQIL